MDKQADQPSTGAIGLAFYLKCMEPWTTAFPHTYTSGLSRHNSDHTPCTITASTNVPKSQTFRFENYWLLHDSFPQALQHGWNIPINQTDSAKSITAKFKNLRSVFKLWRTQLPNLATTIENTKNIIQFMDMMEEARDLSLQEWNFRNIMVDHLQKLLHQQKTYRKQRGKINWVKLGDECTRFFHANASIRHRKNLITSLTDSNGQEFFYHEAKASLLWNAYKERMGRSEYTHMYFDLSNLLQRGENLEWLQDPFTREEIDRIVADLPNDKSPGPDGPRVQMASMGSSLRKLGI